MKNILFIFLLSFVAVPGFTQQRLSHADSITLSRVITIGNWTGTFITDKRGRHSDPDAPNWHINPLIDSFAEKSLDVQGVFDFVKEHAQLLYDHLGSNLYFIAITQKEAIGIMVSNGKPKIDYRTKRDTPAYFKPDNRFIKKMPEN